MTAHVLQFVELSDEGRNAVRSPGKLGKRDRWRSGFGASPGKSRS